MNSDPQIGQWIPWGKGGSYENPVGPQPIVELQLKAQSSKPLEVREQRVGDVQKGLEEIEQAMQTCMGMLEESFAVLTSLQEDPTIQHLETDAWELQMKYDSVCEMAQTVILTQQLAKQQQAKALKD